MNPTRRLTKMFTRTMAGFAVVALAAVASLAAPEASAAPAGDGLLAATWAAHGGIDRWNEERVFAYRLDGFPLSPQVSKPNRSTVDLKTRRNRIEGEGFVVGWNGEQAWATPGPDAVGLPSRFFSLGSFYFIGMPFVFADPGVVLEDKGYQTFRGKSYRVVAAGYDLGTGYTSKDDYHLFIDPDTDRLALINHSVTETGVDRVTWTFDAWQRVDGLLVPSHMTFYAGWNPDDPGQGAAFTIEDVTFSAAAPDGTIYDPPAGAVIDDSPSKH